MTETTERQLETLREDRDQALRYFPAPFVASVVTGLLYAKIPACATAALFALTVWTVPLSIVRVIRCLVRIRRLSRDCWTADLKATARTVFTTLVVAATIVLCVHAVSVALSSLDEGTTVWASLFGFLAIVATLAAGVVAALLTGPDVTIAKHIATQIRTREATPDDEAASGLAAEAGVPEAFSQQFLEALATHYSAGRSRKLRPGMIRPTDTFNETFAVPFDRLSKRMQKSAKEFNRRSRRKDKSCDAGLFEEFVNSAWFTNMTLGPDEETTEHEEFETTLEEIARRPKTTVAGLCRELYLLCQPGETHEVEQE